MDSPKKNVINFLLRRTFQTDVVIQDSLERVGGSRLSQIDSIASFNKEVSGHICSKRP